MKKFKLIALSLLAATFGLTSCELPDFVKKIIPGMDEKVEPTPEPKPEPKPQPQPEVVSVTIRTAVTQVTDETNPFKLVAAVVAKNGASNEVTWSSSDASVATVDQTGLFTPIAEGTTTITAVSKADSSKKDSVEMTVVAIPGVLSVTIQNAPEKVYMHQATQLEAVVAAKGAATKNLSWSSSDETIATVDDDGKVLFSAEGKVTFTATSRFDSTKKGSVEIEGVDGGLHPELITEYGYTYSKTWPEELVNTFAGVEVSPFAIDANGMYYLETEYVPETETAYAQPARFGMILEESDTNFDAILASLDSYFYYYDQYDEYFGFIDPTQVVQFDVLGNQLPDGSYVIELDAYHTAEIFEGSKEATEDTAWNEQVQEYLDALKIDVPFVALGADYDGYYYSSSGILEISDYSVDFTKLENYAETLTQAGFAPVYDNEGEIEYYQKANDAYSSTILAYYFCQYGNSISAMRILNDLDRFPEQGIADFVDSFGSIYDVPTFEPSSSGVTYTFDIGSMDFSEDEDGSDLRDVANVNIYGVSESECTNYVGQLMAAGFEADPSGSVTQEDGVSQMYLQKGKICVVAQIYYLSRESTDAEIDEMLEAYDALPEISSEEEWDALSPEEQAHYNLINSQYIEWLINSFFGDHGYFTVYDYSEVDGAGLYIFGDPSGMEVPGVYIYDEQATIALNDTLQLEPIFFQMDETDVTFTSSDESVATVSAEGVVTAIAEGDAIITVSAMLNEQEVSDSITIHVVKSTSAIAKYVEEANEIFAALGAEEELELPDPEATNVYEDYCGWEEEYNAYFINIDTELSPEEYIAKLSDDYVVFDENDPTEATNGVYIVGAYIDDWDGSLWIYVALYEEMAGDTVDFSQYTSTSGTFDSFSFTTAKGSGQNDPAYNSNSYELRLYVGNTITISSDEEMTEIFFDANTCEHDKANGVLTSDVGTVTAVEGGFLWEGNASEVTFTVSSGKQVHINSFTIAFAEVE